MSYSPAHMSRLVGLLGLAAAGGGCGGVTAAAPDGGGSDAPAVTIDEACSQVSQALCDALNGCAPILVQILYGDEATCVSRSLLTCMTDQSAPGVTRTASDLVTCAKAAATVACADALSGNFPAACDVKPGMVINGMACGTDLQCQSTYCNKTDTCGVCGPRQAAGGACTATAGCMKGLVCANAMCVAPATMGKPCNLPNQPCRSDLYCTSPNGSGSCAAKIAGGGPCMDNPSDACDFSKAAVCNRLANPNVCVTIKVAKPGDACSLASTTGCVGGVDPCSNLLLGGLCANPAQDGEACGGNSVCVPPATCVNKICRLPSSSNCH
jgi:hypothetical protein